MIIGIPQAAGSEQERTHLWESAVPSLLVEAKAREVVVVTVGWMIRSTADKPLPENPRPSEHPDRQEVLCLTHVTPDAAALALAEIVRASEPATRARVGRDARVRRAGRPDDRSDPARPAGGVVKTDEEFVAAAHRAYVEPFEASGDNSIVLDSLTAAHREEREISRPRRRRCLGQRLGVRLGRRRMSMTEHVDSLLAVAGEWTDDDELIEAVRVLKEIAAEHDAVDVRFRAAMDDVQAILLRRLDRA